MVSTELRTGSADSVDVLSALDPQQREVATAVSGPVLVIAGAGTGKTTAITHRIANAVRVGAHDPARSIALTFTNRAAGEMSRRLANLGVADVRVRTFHSAALRQLRWAWPTAVGGSMPELITSKLGLVSAAAARAGIEVDRPMARDLATEIEWSKAVQVAPDRYADTSDRAGRRPPARLEPSRVADVYREYEQAKWDAWRLDFEDVLLLTVAILAERDDLRRKVQASFAHFTVDEFQDVSDIQRRLLHVWLGDRDDICVVGDPDQTIYSFAGADAKHLTSFGAHFPNADVLSLTRCYRCTPEIVAAASRVIDTPRGSRAARRARLVSQCQSGAQPQLLEFADEPAEARAIAGEIADLLATGTAARDIAILVRVNSATAAFEAALAKANIPYAIRGGQRFFERAEVKHAWALLRGAARAGETGPLSELARSRLTDAGWSASPPAGTGAVREAWESLAAMVALADEVAATVDGAGLTDLLGEIDRRAAAQDAPSGDGVVIASLHAAKGLEWDTVFLPNLTDGMVPLSHAATADQLAEERRLLYVGMTRARRRLIMSWSRCRIGGGGRQRRLSRFVTQVPETDWTPVGNGAYASRASRREVGGIISRAKEASHE